MKKKIEWYSVPGGLINSLPQTNWHDWFAWFPVTVETGERVWWKWVSRKIKWRTYDNDTYYRLTSNQTNQSSD